MNNAWPEGVAASASAKQRGFTLVELMIVIAIIGILAAILIPNFLHARAASQTSACEDNLKALATAMEEYAVDHSGQYPASLSGINAPYLTTIPNDPAGGGYSLSANPPPKAAYEIDDGGLHDTTTTGGIPSGPGTGKIVYVQGSGIQAK